MGLCNRIPSPVLPAPRLGNLTTVPSLCQLLFSPLLPSPSQLPNPPLSHYPPNQCWWKWVEPFLVSVDRGSMFSATLLSFTFSVLLFKRAKNRNYFFVDNNSGIILKYHIKVQLHKYGGWESFLRGAKFSPTSNTFTDKKQLRTLYVKIILVKVFTIRHCLILF